MKKILFIAEIGNNHNGDLDRAKRLILASKASGANVAKFQLRNFDTLYRGGIDSVEDLGVEYTKELISKYELSRDTHIELALYCFKNKIEYMCTPWDLESVEFLETLNVRRYKVASADFDNIPLISKIIETGKHLILSTGMASSQDRCLRTV